MKESLERDIFATIVFLGVLVENNLFLFYKMESASSLFRKQRIFQNEEKTEQNKACSKRIKESKNQNRMAVPKKRRSSSKRDLRRKSWKRVGFSTLEKPLFIPKKKRIKKGVKRFGKKIQKSHFKKRNRVARENLEKRLQRLLFS